MDRHSSPGVTKLLGVGVLASTSVLAIYRSWGDAASVALVLLADAALVLMLFLCLRLFDEKDGTGSDARTKTKAAVWALATLLTAMAASGVAAIMPLAVGVLVVLCLRDVNHVRSSDGDGDGGRVFNMDAQYRALAKVGLAVLTCNSALGAYDYDDTRRDTGSAALVLVSYAVLVILTGLFVRAVARAHAGDGDHGQG